MDGVDGRLRSYDETTQEMMSQSIQMLIAHFYEKLNHATKLKVRPLHNDWPAMNQLLDGVDGNTERVKNAITQYFEKCFGRDLMPVASRLYTFVDKFAQIELAVRRANGGKAPTKIIRRPTGRRMKVGDGWIDVMENVEVPI